MIRIAVFPQRDDVMVIFAEDAIVTLPPLRPPFTKASIAEACAKAGVTVRLFESTPGRWSHTFTKLRDHERAERRSEQENQTRIRVALGKQSGIADERDRAALIEKHQGLVTRLRELKQRAAEATDKAATTGEYLPRAEFRNLQREIGETQAAVIAAQSKLRELRLKEHAARQDRFEQRLIEEVKAYLEPDEWEDLVARAEGRADSAQ